MLRRRGRRGKDADDRFAAPPWDKGSPSWQEIDARLPADHLARKIHWIVQQLDLGTLFESYGGRGSQAHRPDLLLKLVLYETQCGKPSPAGWYRDARENDAVKWLLLGMRPCRASVYEFRDRMGDVWDELNAQVLELARHNGVTVGVRSALDGTLVAALASRHKLVNQETLAKRIQELDQAIEADQQGQSPSQLAGWMAKHAETREQQRERYQRAQARMDQLQAENQKRAASDRKKPEKIVVSPSDPEAAVGRDKFKVFRPLYNVQLVYDLDAPLITAYDVFNWQNDAGTMEPVLERQTELIGCKPETLLADSGYTGGPDVAVCVQHGVTLYAPVGENDLSQPKRSGNKALQIPKSQFIWLPDEQTYRCPEGHLLARTTTTRIWHFGDRISLQTTYRCPASYCRACPRKDACTKNPNSGRTISRLEHEDLIEALRRRMATPEAKRLYRLRRQTVELRYADMKEHRHLRRFTGRGLRHAKAQVAATVLAHNGLSLFHAQVASENTPAAVPAPQEMPP